MLYIFFLIYWNNTYSYLEVGVEIGDERGIEGGESNGKEDHSK